MHPVNGQTAKIVLAAQGPHRFGRGSDLAPARRRRAIRKAPLTYELGTAINLIDRRSRTHRLYGVPLPIGAHSINFWASNNLSSAAEHTFHTCAEQAYAQSKHMRSSTRANACDYITTALILLSTLRMPQRPNDLTNKHDQPMR
jgi:hypothetical protein